MIHNLCINLHDMKISSPSCFPNKGGRIGVCVLITQCYVGNRYCSDPFSLKRVEIIFECPVGSIYVK